MKLVTWLLIVYGKNFNISWDDTFPKVLMPELLLTPVILIMILVYLGPFQGHFQPISTFPTLNIKKQR